MRNRIAYIERAMKTVFSERRYQMLGAGNFLFFLTLYAFTFPASYTGGRVGMVSIQFLTPTLAGFAVIMAGLVAVVLPLNLYIIQLGAEASTVSATSGVLGSILTPLLCCSSLIPSLFAVVGAVIPAVAGTSGIVQGFIAIYKMEILVMAILLLAYSVHRSARVMAGCRC